MSGRARIRRPFRESIIEAIELSTRALQAIEDRKGIDPIVLNVKGISSITDMLVIVTGSSPPHLKALGDSIEHALKEGGQRCFHRSGSPDSGWVILDYVDVVVHLLTPEARGYYALEKLWGDAEPWQPPIAEG